MLAISYCDFGVSGEPPRGRKDAVVWHTEESLNQPEPYNFGRTLKEQYDHFVKTYGQKNWRFWMEDMDGNILFENKPFDDSKKMTEQQKEEWARIFRPK